MATLKQFYDYIISADPSAKGAHFLDVINYGLSADPLAEKEINPNEIAAFKESYKLRQKEKDRVAKELTPEQFESRIMETPEGPRYMMPGEQAAPIVRQLPMAAALATAPLTGGMSIPMAIGTQATLGAGIEGYRQAATGGEKDVATAVEKMALEGAKQGATQAGFGAMQLGFGAAKNWIANSPRIQNAIAKTIGALSKKEIKAGTILEAMQREGVPAKMEKVEEFTEKIKYSPDKAIRNIALSEEKVAQQTGTNVLTNAQRLLRNQRRVYGSQVEKADNELIQLAKNKVNVFGANADVIELDDIARKSFLDYYEPIKSNPILKDSVSLGQLEKTIVNMAEKPSISIKEAIDAKRMIAKIFEDFSNKGNMAVQDMGALTMAMKNIRQGLDSAIKSKSTQLGFKKYEDVYSKFGKFADDYDSELLPMLGSKEGAMSTFQRFKKLSGQMNSGDLTPEVIKKISDSLPDDAISRASKKTLSDMTDYLVLSSVYKDLGGAPSSGLVGLARLGLEPITQSFVKLRGGKTFMDMLKTEKAMGSVATPLLNVDR